MNKIVNTFKFIGYWILIIVEYILQFATNIFCTLIHSIGAIIKFSSYLFSTFIITLICFVYFISQTYTLYDFLHLEPYLYFYMTGFFVIALLIAKALFVIGYKIAYLIDIFFWDLNFVFYNKIQNMTKTIFLTSKKIKDEKFDENDFYIHQFKQSKNYWVNNVDDSLTHIHKAYYEGNNDFSFIETRW